MANPVPSPLRGAVVSPSCASPDAKPTARDPAPRYRFAESHRARISRSWRPGALPARSARGPAVPCLPFVPTEHLSDTTAITVCATVRNPIENQAKLEVRHPWDGDALRTSGVGLL